jgi:hypothetical protein
MASSSGSAPAGDGIHLSPLLSLFMHHMLIHKHTVKGFTRVDPHLVDPKSINGTRARLGCRSSLG